MNTNAVLHVHLEGEEVDLKFGSGNIQKNIEVFADAAVLLSFQRLTVEGMAVVSQPHSPVKHDVFLHYILLRNRAVPLVTNETALALKPERFLVSFLVDTLCLSIWLAFQCGLKRLSFIIT